MVAQPAYMQSAFGGGAITPLLDTRFDLKAWHQSAKRLIGYEPVPQGGFRLMARSRLLGRQRNAFAGLAITQVSSDNGPSAGAFTAREYTFDAGTVSLAMVRLVSFSTDTDKDATIRVQYRDPATMTWLPFGFDRFSVTTEAFTRVSAEPPGAPVSADRLRVIVDDMTASVTLTLAGVSAHTETATRVDHAIRPFSFSASETYVMVYQPGYTDVWRDGAHVGGFFHGLTAAMLRRFERAQQFDTLLVFDKDLETPRVQRRGGDHEWQVDDAPWDAIAEVDLGGSYAKTTDVWEIYTIWASAELTELRLNISVDGEETGAILYDIGGGDTINDFAAAVQAAIIALPSIETGVTVSGTVTSSVTFTLHIEFGGDNDGIPFALTAQYVNTADKASALPAHLTIGDTAGEPIMSASRGWPSVGRFTANDRLAIGGFKAKPAALGQSRVGEYFDHAIDKTGDSAAVLDNIGTEGGESIRHLVQASHLVVFTNKAAYFLSDRAVKRDTPRNFVRTGPGAHLQAEIFEIDDQLYYLSNDGAILYTAEYNEVNTRYVTDPVSLLATHLVTGCEETALQERFSETDASRLFIRRSDGALIVAHIVRNQELLGFSEWGNVGSDTIGSVAVDGMGRVHLATTRTIDGAPADYLEMLEEGLVLDCAIDRALAPASTTVDGLDALEGRSDVWAIADGYVVGPFTVAGGEIELPLAATDVTAGVWSAPQMETLPLILQLRDGRVIFRPGRIHTAKVSVIETESLAIGANGQTPYEHVFATAATPPDAPVPPFTGRVEMGGLEGFSDTPTAVITQVRPGKCQVRDVALEAKL